MRVVFDARALGPHFPGIGRAILGVLRGLHEVDHDEQFVVLYKPEHHALLQSTDMDGDPRFSLIAWDDAPLGVAQQWNGPRLARRFRPDVWHAPYYVRPFYGLPPTLVTVYDTIGLRQAGDQASLSRVGHAHHALRRMIWHLAMHESLRTAQHVVTASVAAAADLQRLYRVPTGKLTVVPLATEPQFCPPGTSAIANIRMAYSLPEQYVLYLGSNKPHKNIVALIDAWALVVHDAPPGEHPILVIAGREDPRYPEARQRVTERGLDRHIRFLPDVPDDDLPALIGGALAFVFPSLHEGFGFPPLEAMAVGTPVVSSNRTSLPEVVGDAGLLVEPEPAALAAGIRQLLADEDLRVRLRNQGFERAATFSWERTARTLLELYHGVAERAEHRPAV